MTTLELFLASLGLGFTNVFWCWFIYYEIEQRRKEAAIWIGK